MHLILPTSNTPTFASYTTLKKKTIQTGYMK